MPGDHRQLGRRRLIHGVPGARARHDGGHHDDQRRHRQRQRSEPRVSPGPAGRRRGQPARVAEHPLQGRGVGPLGPPVRGGHVPPGVPERHHQRPRVRHRAGHGERPESGARRPERPPPGLELLRGHRRDHDQRLVPLIMLADGPQLPLPSLGDPVRRGQEDDEGGPGHPVGHGRMPVGPVDGLPRGPDRGQPGPRRVDRDDGTVPGQVPDQHLLEPVEPAQREALDQRGPAERGRPQLQPVVAR